MAIVMSGQGAPTACTPPSATTLGRCGTFVGVAEGGRGAEGRVLVGALVAGPFAVGVTVALGVAEAVGTGPSPSPGIPEALAKGTARIPREVTAARHTAARLESLIGNNPGIPPPHSRTTYSTHRKSQAGYRG